LDPKAKAKDLSHKAKAKDLDFGIKDQGQGQGLTSLEVRQATLWRNKVERQSCSTLLILVLCINLKIH